MLGAFNIGEFCTETALILQFVGYALTIVKIAIPLVIIAYGIFDLGHAVVAEKSDEIKTSAKRLGFRAIAGICIFFIPSLVLWLFSAVATYNSVQGEFETCRKCLLKPSECPTAGAAGTGTGANNY